MPPIFEPECRERVLLVPGILVPALTLAPLAWRLRRQGFATERYGYPTTRKHLEEHGDDLHAALVRRPARHLVGHSMGGLVIRAALARHLHPEIERVVFLGTPHHGARSAEAHGDLWLYRAIFGTRAGQQLRPKSPFYAETPAPRAAFGTVAGCLAGRDHDRVVERSSTHLAGEADWVELAADHHFMLYRADVAALVARFLRTGSFRS